MNRTGITGYSDFDNDEKKHSLKLKPNVWYCNHCYKKIYYDDFFFKVFYGDDSSKDLCVSCYEGLCYGPQ